MEEELEFDREMARMIDLMRDGGIVRYHDALRVFIRHFLRRALRRNGNNVSRAAVELGLHRNTIHRDMEVLGVRQRTRLKK